MRKWALLSALLTLAVAALVARQQNVQIDAAALERLKQLDLQPLAQQLKAWGADLMERAKALRPAAAPTGGGGGFCASCSCGVSLPCSRLVGWYTGLRVAGLASGRRAPCEM